MMHDDSVRYLSSQYLRSQEHPTRDLTVSLVDGKYLLGPFLLSLSFALPS